MKHVTSAHSPCFIDTNIFLRALVREDERTHRECVVFLGAVRSGRIRASTSPLVMAEIVWTLKSFYKLPKDKVLEAVTGITTLRHLRIEARERVDEALALYAAHNIKFIDALIASTSGLREGATCVVSYDREFDRIPGVVRKEPAEILS